ncbi:MAG TPA: trypsin-like peptidase domain-containing protein [Blastocatellia bacterium]|nr:trypsin-like peptidase domain-containing protein [Blastocatellia bacterium]
MKPTYQLTARQLIVLALLTAIFAASGVILYDRFGQSLTGRPADAKEERAKTSETALVAGLTDPSAATDEKNNAEVYKALSPSVVNITSTTYVEDWFNVYPQKGTGSGSILDKSGNILTNYHVIQDAQELDVALDNGKHYKARRVGADPDNDLAIIRINAPASELTPIMLGDSKELFVGQKVLAIGNPFGFDHTLTTGIVSGLARPLRSEFTGRLIEGGVVQTDAAINPGNSGGPLLDSRGRMIGINTMIYSPSGASAGIGFAVPVDTAKRVINDIVAYGYVRRPKLGLVGVIEVDGQIAQALDLPVQQGLMVSQVYPGSAADRAGMRGGRQPVRYRGRLAYIGGDIITKIDGQPVRSTDDLDRLVGSKNIGDRVQVEVLRNGSRMTLSVTLTDPNAAERRRT